MDQNDQRPVVSKPLMVGFMTCMVLVLSASGLEFASDYFNLPWLIDLRIWIYIAAGLLGGIVIWRGFKKQICPSCKFKMTNIGVTFLFCPKCAANLQPPEDNRSPLV
jgi:hypothetical protein